MSRRSLFFLTILFSALQITPALAGDAGRESLFSVGVGARAVAMGGGFTSLSQDGSSVYYNPAGLSRLEAQELSIMYLNLFEGSEFHFGSWVHPLGDKFGFGIGYMRVGTNDIIKTQNFTPIGEFSFSQSQYIFALGYNTSDRISIGGTFKVVNQELDDYSDYSVATDAGVLVMLPRQVRVGLVARDFVAAKFNLYNVDERFPTTIAAGVGVDKFVISQRTKFSGSIELEKAENRNEKLHVGGEVLLDDIYAIRAGYDKDNASMGAGYNIGGLNIDYAYKILDHLDNSHFFSLSYRFGKPQGKAASSAEEVSGAPKTTIEEEFARQFSFYKSKGDNYYDRAEFDTALVYYYKALAFRPDDKDVKGSIDFINKSRQRSAGTESIDQLPTDKSLNQVYLAQAKNFYKDSYYKPALAMIDQALKIAPKDQEALQLKSKIEKDLKNSIDSKMNEARSAERSNELARAVDAYTQVLELDPQYDEARQRRDKLIRQVGVSEKLYLGISQFQEQKYIQARAQFEAVLKSDSTNTIAQDYLNKINQMTSIPTPLEVIQADSKIWPFYLEGLRLMREKQYQKAIDAWHKVLAAYPNSTHTINNIQQAKLRLEAEK